MKSPWLNPRRLQPASGTRILLRVRTPYGSSIVSGSRVEAFDGERWLVEEPLTGAARPLPLSSITGWTNAPPGSFLNGRKPRCVP